MSLVAAIAGLVLLFTLGAWLFALLRRAWNRSRGLPYEMPDLSLLSLLGIFAVIALGTELTLYKARPDLSSHKDDRPPVSSAHRERLELLQRAVRGSVVAQAPKKATQYVPFMVSLQVEPGKLPPLLLAAQASAPDDTAFVAKEDVWLAPVMEATVYGDGFEFQPKDKQSYAQPVALKEPTTWTWQVQPVDSGTLSLTFRLSGTFKVERQKEEFARELYGEAFTVTVDVNPAGFFKRNWEKLLTMAGAAIAAVAGGIWAYWKWRRPSPIDPKS